MQGAYKCNLRAYMMTKDYEPAVKSLEVNPHATEFIIGLYPFLVFAGYAQGWHGEAPAHPPRKCIH